MENKDLYSQTHTLDYAAYQDMLHDEEILAAGEFIRNGTAPKPHEFVCQPVMLVQDGDGAMIIEPVNEVI